MRSREEIAPRFAKVFKKEQSSNRARLYSVGVKSKEPTLKQTLSVPCPTCGAAIKEVCELHTGAPRSEAHRDRKLFAAEAVEAKPKQG
jgi:hypothetical protein